MTEPTRMQVDPPALFVGFRERQTQGQRRRAARDRVYTFVYRIRRRLGRA